MKRIAILLCAIFATAVASAQTPKPPTDKALDIGDKAPPLEVGSWLKGSPIDKLDPRSSTIYVIEFWATWCGPCKVSIPHLTELQKTFSGKVAVIGIDSFEQDWSKSSPFVTEMGDKMGYAVATDKLASPTDREGSMAKSWMDASHEPGIPTAFIVRYGTIDWIGNPMAIDAPLQDIVADNWDTDSFKRDRDIGRQQSEEKAAQGAKLMSEFNAEASSKDWPAAFRTLDVYEQIGPDEAQRAAAMRDGLLHMINDVPQITDYLERESAKSTQALNALADVASSDNEVAALRTLDAAQSAIEAELITAKTRHLDVYLKCGDMSAFGALAHKIVADKDNVNADCLDHIAWLIASPDQATNDKISKLKFPMGYGNVPTFPAGCHREQLLSLAKTAIERAIEVDGGKTAAYYDTLAWVDYQSGNKEGAIKDEAIAGSKAPAGTMEQANYQFIGQWFGGSAQKGVR